MAERSGMHSIVVNKDKPQEQKEFKASFSLLSPDMVAAKAAQVQAQSQSLQASQAVNLQGGTNEQ
ncbi:hypothetical protein JCM19237_4925 [Photobacterium aphoticum]|uniref:Uncharacterized protein n=1 Tax=Photobacterium aphoticum TaxID=754436 RepID=A0A090RE54_9GAMM|nr:hypothetical protein JCM19237_4925 [Photobacterium aphoticum]